jgi:hypothetical protein
MSQNLAWVNKVMGAGWELTKPTGSLQFLFSRRRLNKTPRDLRSVSPSQIRQKFDSLFSDQRFTQWWDQTCGGKQDKYIRLSFPDHSFLTSIFTSPWDVPWELLIERLKQTEVHSTVSLVRSSMIDPPIAPRVSDEPMRILVLQGDDGKSIRRPLNLDIEAEQIAQAWNALDASARECVDKPKVVKATRADLPKDLNDHKPHLIWFSGHGRIDPNSSLLLADGQWVTAGEFANLIKRSCEPPFQGLPPLYAVFWACETGRAEISRTGAISPTLFEELAKVGVISVMGMQSAIRDVSALSMAQGLMRFLAAGYPMETAIARVRAHLIDDLPSGAHEMDWAAPVVWSVGEPVEKLCWNSQAQPLVQFQLLGREALRWRRKKPSELDGPPTVDDLMRARTWSSLPKVWVYGRYDDAESQNRWVRALQALQVETKNFVVAIDLTEREIDVALQAWAEKIYERMLPNDFPIEFMMLLKQMKAAPISGWRRLCELPGLQVAIAQPPVFDAPSHDSFSWFWEPLFSAENTLKTIIFSDQQVSAEIEEAWSLDRIESDMDTESIETAVKSAPRLARALAVLNMPLSPYLISVPVDDGEGAGRLSDWTDRNRLVIETFAGPVLTATARRHILERQDSTQLKIAHYDCARILAQPQVRPTAEIRKELLDHFLGSGDTPRAINLSADLLFFYKQQDRPVAVQQLIRQLGSLWQDLPASARLVPAWAYLQLGKLGHAEMFLERAAPTSPLDVAWKHGLRAELFKSQGTAFSKENALSEIEAAIQTCRATAPDLETPAALIQRRLRAYRQDRARILQFLFYRTEEAASEYSELIGEWSDQPDAVIDLAVVKRNYAECLRYLSTGPTDPRSQQSNDILREAEALVKHRPDIPIFCEILYEKAKAAEQTNRLSESLRLLSECQTAAKQSQHFMVWAIADSRRFWKHEGFLLSRWSIVQRQLQAFSHGWAVRTLVTGFLKAARRLEESKDYEGAIAQLEKAELTMSRNPSFNMGGDKFRIAAIRAGLHVVGAKLGRTDSWSTFAIEFDWAIGWLENRLHKTPEDIWSEVG